MGIFDIFKSKETRFFESQKEALIDSKIELCSLSKRYIEKPMHDFGFSSIEIPRQLFVMMDGLNPERLTTILIAYNLSSSADDFNRLSGLLSGCFDFQFEEETLGKYKDCVKIIAFTIHRYFGEVRDEKKIVDLCCILLNKFKQSNFIDVVEESEQIFLKSARNFLMHIYKEDLSIRISPSIAVDDDNNVYMRHGDQYSIYVFNDDDTEGDAEIFIDNKKIGRFRICKHSSIKVERPINDTGRLTFYEYGTEEGFFAGIKKEMGYITVRFYRKKRELYYSLAKGGTGLSGKSQQHFKYAEKIETENKYTEVSLRLISYKERPKQL